MIHPIRIVVADDDPVIRTATSRVLRGAGYEVGEAAGGEECLRLVSETTPDLVLLDVVMPDLDGYEVCRRIKNTEELQEVHVVLISGTRTSSDNRSEGLELGSDGYLARPISNRELTAHVASMARIIHAEKDRDRLIAELREALDTVERLEGLLPICATCKKIRGEAGEWKEVEVYVSSHSKAVFSHGMCPDCESDFHSELDRLTK